MTDSSRKPRAALPNWSQTDVNRLAHLLRGAADEIDRLTVRMAHSDSRIAELERDVRALKQAQ